MKKTKLMLVAVAMFIALTAFGQIYFNLGTGYHMQALDNLTSYTANNGEVDSSTYSLGGGMPINIGLGIGLTNNLSVEINGEYLNGGEIEVFNSQVDVPSAKNSDIITTKSTQLRLIPSILYSTGNEGLSFYGKVGLVVPVSGTTEGERVFINEKSSAANITEGFESVSEFSLGFRAGAGVSLGLTNNVSLIGGFELTSLKIQGSSTTITKYEVGGKDGLSGYSMWQKKTVFSDNPNEAQMNPAHPDFDNSKPNEAKYEDPASYGSWGINLGIKYTLGN